MNLGLKDKMGQPEEPAALIAFLASERAAYITGTAIQVDGWLRQGTTLRQTGNFELRIADRRFNELLKKGSKYDETEHSRTKSHRRIY